MLNSIATVITAAFVGIGLAFLVGILLAWPIKVCWNEVMPDLFHLPHITLWQALILSLLVKLLLPSTSTSSKD